MKISVFGLGYVGAVSLACLARDGHSLIGVDTDPAKVALIRDGHTPVVEEGLVDLVKQVVSSGRVQVTSDAIGAVQETALSLVCVGTPSEGNGSQNQASVRGVATEIGRALRKKGSSHTIAFRSTVTPGTVEDELIPILESESGKRDGSAFHVCFQPEFLREGSSIHDFDHPPFTVVGALRDEPVDLLRSVFGHLPCEFLHTSIRAAEMLKYACNNFHALKITFANEIARLCKTLGVDPFEVMDLVCRDKQLNVSPAYLRPGFAFGGSCLPKDLRATIHFAKMRDVEIPMLASILPSNRAHLELACKAIITSGCRKIGLVGLSFKAGTDDLRESPMVALAEFLVGKGIELHIYDPAVHLSQLIGANRLFIEKHVPHLGAMLRSKVEDVIYRSELLVVGFSSPSIVSALSTHVRRSQIVIDLVGLQGKVPNEVDLRGFAW